MIRIFAILLSLTILTPDSKTNEVRKLRQLFYTSAENSDSSTTLFDQLQEINNQSPPILLGYKGMSYLLEAKHSYSVYKKFSYFYKGTSILDTSIVMAPSNRELRFFRYSVQDNAPSFLGYNKNLKNDKKTILFEIEKETDSDLKYKINEYFKLR
jgi:hypothetical protein